MKNSPAKQGIAQWGNLGEGMIGGLRPSFLVSARESVD